MLEDLIYLRREDRVSGLAREIRWIDARGMMLVAVVQVKEDGDGTEAGD